MAPDTLQKPAETAKTPLVSTDYRTIKYVTGPLVFVDNVHSVAYNEMVAIRMPDGTRRSGQVLEISGGRIVEMTFFLDTATLFPLFGLPARLEA